LETRKEHEGRELRSAHAPRQVEADLLALLEADTKLGRLDDGYGAVAGTLRDLIDAGLALVPEGMDGEAL